MTRAQWRSLLPAPHPPLVAIYPILFLYAVNPSQTSFPWAAAGVMFAAAAVASLALGWLFSQRAKAALLVSFALLLGYSYGHVFDALRAVLGGYHLAGLEVLRHRHLLLLYALVGSVGCLLLWRAKRSVEPLKHILTAAVLAAVLMSTVKLALFEVQTLRVPTDAAALTLEGSALDSPAGRAVRPDALPNIYYIILDGRANSQVLDEYFGYSDAAFTGYLEQKGFYIAPRSHANYAMTFLSLASSLNMQYLDYVTEAVGRDGTDESLPRWLINNNKLARLLKAKGYRFVNVSSGWGATNWMPLADLNLKVGNPLGEFYDVLLQTTILRPLAVGRATDKARQRVLRSFEGLLEVDTIARPTFVFAHVLAPHPPFVFGRNGEPVRAAKVELFGAAWKRKDEYLDQLAFVDGKVREVVDRILAHSEVPPVIVIQSDHGPASSGDLVKPTERFLRERLPIFNAYYLPGVGRTALYESISPVNSFRVILNQYLGARFELLEDEIYYSDPTRPYHFQNLTAQLLGGGQSPPVASSDPSGEVRAGRP